MEKITAIIGDKKAYLDAIRKRTGAQLEEYKAPKLAGGFIIPNATQFPNELIDEWLCALTGAELKVLIYIIRKTFGYNKRKGDAIPLSQICNGTTTKNGKIIDKGTGLSKRAVIEAISTLEGARLIEVVRKVDSSGNKKTSFYRLITRDSY